MTRFAVLMSFSSLAIAGGARVEFKNSAHVAANLATQPEHTCAECEQAVAMFGSMVTPCEQMPGCKKCLDCSAPPECLHCQQTLAAFGKASACALKECTACIDCGQDDDLGGGGDDLGGDDLGACGHLYKEQQRGLKCGLHATNAVLRNIGLEKTNETFLDAQSVMVGAPSNGDDYDIATLMFTLMAKIGGSVTSSGELGNQERPISELLAEVGAIDESALANLGPEERAAYLRQQRVVTFDDTQWIICNTHGHWKTYFHNNTAWCNLDSMIPRPQEVDAAALRSTRCRAVIVPLPY